jgi:hypothetical protein
MELKTIPNTAHIRTQILGFWLQEQVNELKRHLQRTRDMIQAQQQRRGDLQTLHAALFEREKTAWLIRDALVSATPATTSPLCIAGDRQLKDGDSNSHGKETTLPQVSYYL